jgi:MerR family transcriptional regulator, copper efflux regulator
MLMPDTGCELMTVGQLSRRTGLSIKAIREYEALGLIYSAGRSEGNYRLFDPTALWCARVINEMRSVGLTIKEIKQLADAYLADPDEPIGPRIAAALDRSEHRVDTQIQELEALRRRITNYRERNAAALAGAANSDFAAGDPRHAQHAA